MAPVDFGNLKTESGIQKLNEHLVTRSYITGYQPTQDDVTTLGKMLSAPDAKKYPHAARWYKHIAHFTPAQKKAFKAGELAKTPASKPQAKDEDDIDLFGEETAEDKEAAKKLAESKKKEADKKKKEAPVAKSLLLIDVKPMSTEVNLDNVWKLIQENVKMDGLVWKEQVKKVPVAFGIFKLQVGCTVEDEKVSTDELIERIENIGLTEEDLEKRQADDYDEDEDESGLVQSAEIVVFNKL